MAATTRTHHLDHPLWCIAQTFTKQSAEGGGDIKSKTLSGRCHLGSEKSMPLSFARRRHAAMSDQAIKDEVATGSPESCTSMEVGIFPALLLPSVTR
jgi:hypothetical protein